MKLCSADTSRSPFADSRPADMHCIRWLPGFWSVRFRQLETVTLSHLFELGEHPEMGMVVRNMRIAAGLETGAYGGNDWYDEWIHKWIEAASVVWAQTRDARLEARINEWIELVRDAQAPDGYLATQVQVRGEPRYNNPRRHECYVMGHFLTAACVHHRATGQEQYLQAAVRCGHHLHQRFTRHREEMKHFPLNPSLIMGAVELYRATEVSAFLELAQVIVDLRGSAGRDRSNPGAYGDQTQDRVPILEEEEVVGHSVFWSYLYAGATDIFMESGDERLLSVLERLWQDVVARKLYITGGCGAIDIGKSMRSEESLAKLKLADTSYFDGSVYWDRDDVHEAVGPAYHLPNAAAYNETCGQIGLHLWSWRMLLATGEPKYAEVMEREMYNGFLSGIGLNGVEFSYSNTLRCYGEAHGRRVQPVAHRVPMAKEFKSCCPTNLVRTLAQIHGFLYSFSDQALTFHHYAACRLAEDNIVLTQETRFPWDGEVQVRIEKAPAEPFRLRFRIPEWAEGASLQVNGAVETEKARASSYVEVRRVWAPQDEVCLKLPMRVRILMAHPKVEEARNQVAVMRGPIVYCLEAHDLPDGVALDQVFLPVDADLRPVAVEDPLGGHVVLEGEATCRSSACPEELYREVEPSATGEQRTLVRLIPYYAWSNRGITEMSVWLPRA